MTIPANVDPARVIALCFGISLPSDSAHARSVTLHRLLTFLEIPEAKFLQIIARAEPRIKATFDKRESGPGQWLQMPSLATEFFNVLGEVIQETFAETSINLGEAIEALISHPRLPDELMSRLIGAVVYKSAQRSRDRAQESSMAFCSTLFRGSPGGYVQALQSPEFRGGADTETTNALEPISRIGYRLRCAKDYWRSKKLKKSIKFILRAWSEAFEEYIVPCCHFITAIAYASGVPTYPKIAFPLPTAPEERRRICRQIFETARDWCIEQGIRFPFYPHFNDIDSDRFYIQRSSIELNTKAGERLPPMLVESLLAIVSSDIDFAFRFRSSAPLAVLEFADQQGVLEQAWGEAIQIIPALATATTEKLPTQTRRHKKPRPRPAPEKAPPVANAMKTICDLLTSAFSASELRMFVVHNYETEVVQHLPESCSLATLANEITQLLARRYTQFQPRLFELLLSVRPNRSEEIVRLAEQLGVKLGHDRKGRFEMSG